MCVAVDRRGRGALVAGPHGRNGQRRRGDHRRQRATRKLERRCDDGRNGERATRGDGLMTRVTLCAAMAASLFVTVALCGRATAAPVPKGDDNKSWVGRTVLPKKTDPFAV